MALAYFLTFSTYGSWLHGTDNEQGSVDDKNNAFGAPFLKENLARAKYESTAMKQPVYTLDEDRRKVALDAIVKMAIDKKWNLWAAHVRSTHIHIVISADKEPGRLMSDIKAKISRSLTKAGFDNKDTKRWTRHGSTRHLFTQEQVAEKIVYVVEEQGKPMALYDARKK